MELPEELVCEVMGHLPHSDLGRFTQTCRDFYRIGNEDRIWRKKGFLKRSADIAFAGSESGPTPRLCHSSVSYNNKMYIFGGHNTESDSQRFSEVRNDLYALDFSSSKWEKLQVKSLPNKTEHSTVVHKDKLYMFGGYSGVTFSNSMYMLNLSTASQCVSIKARGDTPCGRSAHVGIVFEDKFYMFGGWDGVVQNNDFYSMDFETMTWNKIQNVSMPHPRCSHTAALSERRRTLYVFGGFGGRAKNYLSDMWAYNFDTKTWTELETRGEVPSPRSRMRMVEWNDKLFVYGGWDKSNHFDELYQYDIATSTWTKIDFGIDSNDESLKIGQFSMSLNDNILYIFGGYSAQLKKSTNDLYSYRLGYSKHSLCNQLFDSEEWDDRKFSRIEAASAMTL